MFVLARAYLNLCGCTVLVVFEGCYILVFLASRSGNISFLRAHFNAELYVIYKQ